MGMLGAEDFHRRIYGANYGFLQSLILAFWEYWLNSPDEKWAVFIVFKRLNIRSRIPAES